MIHGVTGELAPLVAANPGHEGVSESQTRRGTASDRQMDG